MLNKLKSSKTDQSEQVVHYSSILVLSWATFTVEVEGRSFSALSPPPAAAIVNDVTACSLQEVHVVNHYALLHVDC